MSEVRLIELFTRWAGESPVSVSPLPGSGSARAYYRIQGTSCSAIGVSHDDRRENEAFLSFTRSFAGCGLPVPELYAEDLSGNVYLLRDLGDQTLFSLLTDARKEGKEWSKEIINIYKSVLTLLPRFQVDAARHIDYDKCYPRAVFDRQSMLWDLNYFKYYFLKLARIPFDEQALEEDFSRFSAFLEQAGSDHFMYRDFQSRNIMIVHGEPFFIDYQGGRKGALQYDVASLLTDAKADMPFEVRRELLFYYLDELEKIHPVKREEFLEYYYGFALIRILQALGAYGFRGYYENKPHFLQSIPYALRNLRYLREKSKIGFGLTTLMEVIDRMISHPGLQFLPEEAGSLTLTINSFSYKAGIPPDPSGHGGGFVFDCRALPNPGRDEAFRELTGRDQPVIDFLKREPAVDEFMNHAFSLIDQSVRNYVIRNFQNLVVSFGCTGGQHRSVYCAEELARFIRSKYTISVVVNHLSHPEKQ